MPIAPSTTRRAVQPGGGAVSIVVSTNPQPVTVDLTPSAVVQPGTRLL